MRPYLEVFYGLTFAAIFALGSTVGPLLLLIVVLYLIRRIVLR